MNDIDISPEHTELLMQAASSVGKKFARQYPSVDAQDIASEARIQILEDWPRIMGKLESAEDYGQTKYTVLHFLLSEKAKVYCDKRHYQYMIEHPHALVYTPKEVRAVLKECYYDPGMYETPGRDEHMGTVTEPKSVWVNLADLKEALDRVPDKVHDIILAAFGPKALDLPSPDSRRVSDAVNVVTRELNRHLNQPRHMHEGPGSRRAMSNSTAQSITSEEY